jgi:hypothetical protein
VINYFLIAFEPIDGCFSSIFSSLLRRKFARRKKKIFFTRAKHTDDVYCAWSNVSEEKIAFSVFFEP